MIFGSNKKESSPEGGEKIWKKETIVKPSP
jgi:hypothetical protein